ncbi:hypothetical protein [Krasilnikovia sp. MM14-A1259]|uniref:hypothetical protein n=1 Tax=Krasilnikovia sp. MM14-A1259 TaxID=3373539 RepID=UPI003813924D
MDPVDLLALEAVWRPHGAKLVRRMLALADQVEACPLIPGVTAALLIRDVLETDYDPLQAPQGVPPNRGIASRGIATEPGS